MRRTRLVPLTTTTTPAAAAAQLRATASETTQVNFADHDGERVLNRYLSWTSQAERMLGNHLDSEAVHELIQSRYYWELRVSDRSHPRLVGEIAAELRRREFALVELASEVDAVGKRWHSEPSTIIAVLDTNVFLNEKQPAWEVPWSDRCQAPTRLVVPLAVVYELDKLKRTTWTKSMARQSTKWLFDTLPMNPSDRAKIQGQAGVTVEVLVHEGRFDVDADGSIIEVAAWLKTVSNVGVKVVSRDFNMCVRARAAEVDVIYWQDEPEGS